METINKNIIYICYQFTIKTAHGKNRCNKQTNENKKPKERKTKTKTKTYANRNTNTTKQMKMKIKKQNCIEIRNRFVA